MTPLVPRLWPGETFVCLGGGPSLTQEDVDACQGHRIIAINDSYKLTDPDVIYAADAKWWKRNPETFALDCFRYSLQPNKLPSHQVIALQVTGLTGLETWSGGLRTGGNSGYQAINLAVHLGAFKIILLGYDMQKQGRRQHWHEDHPEQRPCNFKAWISYFPTLIEHLRRHHVEVINCTRETALTCFPRMPLEDALA
jgi:hypothetical protein